VKRYLDNLVLSAKESGAAVTYFGRRRPVPELKESNFMRRQFGERVAMNMPVQGTAADIMKIAMVRVHDMLISGALKSKLILQIHDELLIETAPGEEEQVKDLLKEGMMGAVKLAVPLEVDVNTGKDFYEAH
jgi:DNA polymerase-1